MIRRLLSCLIAAVLRSFLDRPLTVAAQLSQQSPVSPVAAEPAQAAVSQALRSSPVMFIENVGQFAEGARFQVRGGDSTMWLAEDAIWITVVEQAVRRRTCRARRLAHG